MTIGAVAGDNGPMAEEDVFASTVPYQPQRVEAAAVYCSDGRIGEQIDDLLHHALELPRYDRLAIPGGPACLAGYFAAYRDRETVVGQLEFLINVHRLQRVVLIAHEDCAFYTERLDASPLGLDKRQREDLAKAVERVRQIGPQLVVDAYFARPEDDQIIFERIPGER